MGRHKVEGGDKAHGGMYDRTRYFSRSVAGRYPWLSRAGTGHFTWKMVELFDADYDTTATFDDDVPIPCGAVDVSNRTPQSVTKKTGLGSSYGEERAQLAADEYFARHPDDEWFVNYYINKLARSSEAA